MPAPPTIYPAQVLKAFRAEKSADVPGVRAAWAAIGGLIGAEGIPSSQADRDRIGDALEALGLEPAEMIPRQWLAAFAEALELYEPPMPAWAEPGAMIFVECRGVRGVWLKVERATSAGVYFEGHADLMPPGVLRGHQHLGAAEAVTKSWRCLEGSVYLPTIESKCVAPAM